MRIVFKCITSLLIYQLTLVSSIHYGDEAKRNQFPFLVLINSPRFFCSGALISDRHILTAAHCLMSIRKGNAVEVSIGGYNYIGSGRTDGKTIFSKKFWMHEDFSMPSAVNDIGIIELPMRLNFSQSIQPLNISTKLNADLDVHDNEVILVGWGYTEYSIGVSKRPQYTKMNLISLNECEKFKSHYIEDLTEKHICSKLVEGKPCDGDSGAVIISTKTNEIIGILSYGKDAENGIDMGYNDCDADVPAVSTRIYSYIDWINDKTGLNIGRNVPNERELKNDLNKPEFTFVNHLINSTSKIISAMSARTINR